VLIGRRATWAADSTPPFEVMIENGVRSPQSA